MSTAGSATALKVAGCPIPVADTEIAFVPRFGPSVSVLSALPFLSVMVCVTLRVPSPAVTVNVTTIPSSTERFSSLTSTTNGFARTAPDMPVWLSPETFESPDVIKTVVGVISTSSYFFFSTKYSKVFAGVILDKPDSTNLSWDMQKVGSSAILIENLFSISVKGI